MNQYRVNRMDLHWTSQPLSLLIIPTSSTHPHTQIPQGIFAHAGSTCEEDLSIFLCLWTSASQKSTSYSAICIEKQICLNDLVLIRRKQIYSPLWGHQHSRLQLFIASLHINSNLSPVRVSPPRLHLISQTLSLRDGRTNEEKKQGTVPRSPWTTYIITCENWNMYSK